MADGRARTIGLDLGAARCGVAIDDELGAIAHPRPYVAAKDRKLLVETLVDLAKKENAARFVLGLPVELSGKEGIAAEKTRRFAQQLADASGLDVILWDERLTTVQAADRLRDGGTRAREAKETIDSAAAALILQGWLDAQRLKKKGKKER